MYNDDQTSWFADELNDLVEKGILQGLYGETFDTNKEITSGEFVQLVQKSRELGPTSEENVSFTDVRKEYSYSPAISVLVASDIINGYKNGLFVFYKKGASQKSVFSDFWDAPFFFIWRAYEAAP
ncbi:S-layer homology domain-containing protein [Bacillus sp. 72]|uniref:S-layer homology domain-containing protein n=1 Tax=Domibacillus aminovorans TaxID=29332 RepID=UPI001D0CC7D2